MHVHEQVRRNDAGSRYELVLGGQVVSFAEFHEAGQLVIFPHTVTLPEFRGNGYAARVVRTALDDARAGGKSVVAQCWFVRQFLRDHPEYHDLLVA